MAFEKLSLLYRYLVPALCDMVVYNMCGKIVSLKISAKKGVSKKPVKEASLKTEYGIEEDGRRSHYGGR